MDVRYEPNVPEAESLDIEVIQRLRYLTFEQAKVWTHTKRDTFQTLINAGLPKIKFGRKVLYDKVDIDNVMNSLKV